MTIRYVGSRCDHCGHRPVWRDDHCSRCWWLLASIGERPVSRRPIEPELPDFDAWPTIDPNRRAA